MNKQIPQPFTIGLLSLLIGSGCIRDISGPSPAPFCANQPAAAIVAFEDAILEAAIREAVLIGPQSNLTCGLVETVTDLTEGWAGIVSLAGIENLTGLTNLWIRANEITDISPLGGLVGLTALNLADNAITDVSALSGLRRLTFLAINLNGTIVDLSPLSGLTELTGNVWLHDNSITDLGALSGLTNLTGINAWNNSITDLGGLSKLTGLTQLHLDNNSVTDLSELSGLTNLTRVSLRTNADLSNIQPLLDNPGLGEGDSVLLEGTNVSCSDVDALRAKGVEVSSDCP